MAERWTPRQALHQAIGVLIVAALIAVAIAYIKAQPQGRGSLKAEVSALRSQAAEGAVVLERGDKLDRRFLRAHLGQLAHNVTRTRKRIADLHLEPAVQGSQRNALDLASRVESSIGGVVDDHARATLRGSKSELERLEQDLER